MRNHLAKAVWGGMVYSGLQLQVQVGQGMVIGAQRDGHFEWAYRKQSMNVGS